MTPVYQTIFRAPGGNCFQACVASIMDLPVDSVPHFLKDADGGPWNQSQWDEVRKFAQSHGYEAQWLDPDLSEDLPQIETLMQSGLHYVATGKSPLTDYGHCVVAAGGKTVHDPMGNVGGCPIVGDPWLYVFFVESKDVAPSPLQFP